MIAWGVFQVYKISKKEQNMITQYFPPKYTFTEESPTLSTESSRKVRHLTGASSELLSVLVLNLPHYPSVPTGHWPPGFLPSTKTQTGHRSLILDWFEVCCNPFGLGGSGEYPNYNIPCNIFCQRDWGRGHTCKKREIPEIYLRNFFLDFPQNLRLRTRNQYCTQAIAWGSTI